MEMVGILAKQDVKHAETIAETYTRQTAQILRVPGVCIGVSNGFADGTNSGASPRSVPVTAPPRETAEVTQSNRQ